MHIFPSHARHIESLRLEHSEFRTPNCMDIVLALGILGNLFTREAKDTTFISGNRSTIVPEFPVLIDTSSTRPKCVPWRSHCPGWNFLLNYVMHSEGLKNIKLFLRSFTQSKHRDQQCYPAKPVYHWIAMQRGEWPNLDTWGGAL